MIADGVAEAGLARAQVLGVFDQILSHAEGASGSRQHDGAHAGVVRGALDMVAKCDLGGGIEAVHGVGPVERDSGDVAVDLIANWIGHVGSPLFEAG
jgi:hypothetical protein